MELRESDRDEAREQIEEARDAIKHLYEMVLEDKQGFDTESDFYEKGDEEAPFFSEAYLYNLLGKEDARSVLAALHRVEEWLASYNGIHDVAALDRAREMKKRKHWARSA